MSVYESFVSKRDEQYAYLEQFQHQSSATSEKKDHQSDGQSSLTPDIVCPISLTSLEPSSNALDWISIPTSSTDVYHHYSVDGLYQYGEIKNWFNLRNPQGATSICIDFMKPRIVHLYHIKDRYHISVKDLTPQYRDNLLDKFIACAASDRPTDEIQNLGFLINIRLWFKRGLIHVYTAEQAEEILDDKEDGSFLLRKSKHVVSETDKSPMSIFTISFKHGQGVYHERYLYINSVGMYKVHYSIWSPIWNYIHASELIPVLQWFYKGHTYYPQYIGITDLLLNLRQKGMISLDRMICPT